MNRINEINEKIAKLENEIKQLKIEKAEIEESGAVKTLNKKESEKLAKEVKAIFKDVLGVSGRAPKYNSGRESAVVFGAYSEKGSKRGVYGVDARVCQTNSMRDFSDETIKELKNRLSEVAVVESFKFKRGDQLTNKGDDLKWVLTSRK